MSPKIRRRGKTDADTVLSLLLAEKTVAQAAKQLRVSPTTVRRWVKTAVPPHAQAGVRATYGRSTAHDAMEANLADARLCTSEVLRGDPTEKISVNKDGSIDAQLTVYDIPRGLSLGRLIDQLDFCCRSLDNIFNAWIQVGVRWGGRGETSPVPDSGDRRYRGLAEGSTFYYPIDGSGRALAFDYAGAMAKKIQAKRRNRKIETIFVRLHWNPDGAAPKTWNPKKAVYRAYKNKREGKK